MLVNEMGLKQLVVIARVVQGRILVIWCHFPKIVENVDFNGTYDSR